MEGANYRAPGLFASLDDLFVQRVPESAMRFVFSDVYNRQRREHNHMCYPKKSCIVGCRTTAKEVHTEWVHLQLLLVRV